MNKDTDLAVLREALESARAACEDISTKYYMISMEDKAGSIKRNRASWKMRAADECCKAIRALPGFTDDTCHTATSTKEGVVRVWCSACNGSGWADPLNPVYGLVCRLCDGSGIYQAATDSAATVAKDGGEVRALIEENRQLTARINEWRDKHTESEESRMELLRLLNEETSGSTFMGEPVLPTPKPEASAATQPWRDAVLDQCAIAHMPFHEDDPRKTLEDLISWHVEVSHDPAVSDRAATQQAVADAARRFLACVNERKDAELRFTTADGHTEYDRARSQLQKVLAAPISEDTGRTWATDGGYRCKNCGNGLTSHKNQRDCQPPAAQVSDGDAMPFTTDEARAYLVEFMNQHFTDKTFDRYIRGLISPGGQLAGDFAWQMATALRRLAARTVTGSGGSIGETVEFGILISGVKLASQHCVNVQPAIDALIAYIDARTARNAGVAAPDTSARKLTGAEILADPFLAYHFGLNRGKGPVSPTGWKIVRAVQTILAKSKGQS